VRGQHGGECLEPRQLGRNRSRDDSRSRKGAGSKAVLTADGSPTAQGEKLRAAQFTRKGFRVYPRRNPMDRKEKSHLRAILAIRFWQYEKRRTRMSARVQAIRPPGREPCVS
jgi:hypothetical protein